MDYAADSSGDDNEEWLESPDNPVANYIRQDLISEILGQDFMDTEEHIDEDKAELELEQDRPMLDSRTYFCYN
jgi:hypothetical protein